MAVSLGSQHPTFVVKLISSTRLALESYLVFLVLIMLATRYSMIERKLSPFPNQLKPNRSDSWAIFFGATRGTLFLNALCTNRHMVNQDLVGLILVI